MHLQGRERRPGVAQGQGGGLAAGGGTGVQDAGHGAVPGVGQQSLGAAVLHHAGPGLQPGPGEGGPFDQPQAARQVRIRRQAFGQPALQEAEGGAGGLLEPGPEELDPILGPVGRQGGPQGPLRRGRPVQGGGQGLQLRGQGGAIPGGPPQEGIHQTLVGGEAQVAGGRQLHGLVDGRVVADAGQPGQLGEAHGQGHPGSQGHTPGWILQLRRHPGLEAPPATQAEAEQGLGQVRILAQVAVPDVRHPALLTEDFVEGVGDMETGGRGHGAPGRRNLDYGPWARTPAGGRPTVPSASLSGTRGPEAP